MPLLNVSLENIEGKITTIKALNSDLATNLELINTKFEGVQGITSRDVIKIKEKYAIAKNSQKELTEAIEGITSYLKTVVTNYENAQSQVN